MELYQLRTFLIVAEEKSITRAAKRLFTTPPSISAHIKTLEDEWNVVLFRRIPRGMEITEKGEMLRRKAEATLLAAQDLSNHATELHGSLMGSLRVGLNTSTTFLRVQPLVISLQNQQPGIEPRFFNRSSGEVIEDLKEEQLDAGFVFGTFTDKFISTHWLTNTEVVVVGPSKWKEQMPEADWPAIARLPWIHSANYCPFQSMADQLFKDRNLECQRTIQTDDDRTKVELIAAGLGIALIVKSEAEEAAMTGNVFIWQTPPITCDLFFAHLTSRSQDPLIRSLRENVLEVWDTAESTSSSTRLRAIK